MKNVICLLSISFFAFLSGNAQSENHSFESQVNKVISVFEASKQPVNAYNNFVKAQLKINLDLPVSRSLKSEQRLVRTKSDIRIYLTRIKLKRVDNINLLFPKINKPVIS